MVEPCLLKVDLRFGFDVVFTQMNGYILRELEYLKSQKMTLQ